jgi:2'-5' RNA ligase
MRLFIGIGVPRLVGGLLERLTRTLLPLEAATGARIRQTSPENMHITLSFLGSVEVSRLEEIQQSLAELRAGTLHLRIDGIVANAGLLYARVKPSTALISFVEQVFRAMEHCGFSRDPRPYMPHVTLARSKQEIRLKSPTIPVLAFRQRFEVHKFRLYQSFTGPSGSRYKVLKEFPLFQVDRRRDRNA